MPALCSWSLPNIISHACEEEVHTEMHTHVLVQEELRRSLLSIFYPFPFLLLFSSFLIDSPLLYGYFPSLSISIFIIYFPDSPLLYSACPA